MVCIVSVLTIPGVFFRDELAHFLEQYFSGPITTFLHSVAKQIFGVYFLGRRLLLSVAAHDCEQNKLPLNVVFSLFGGHVI